MKVLIKHFKESGLTPETMLCTQRSRRFPKPEKSVIFGIFAKGKDRLKNCWKAEILERKRKNVGKLKF